METDITDYLRQPDSVTCQSAAVGKVLGLTGIQDVYQVRRDLDSIGRSMGTSAGSPAVMGQYLKPKVIGYSYSPRASLKQIVDWVNRGRGYEVIIHGSTTGSGHVWGIESAVETSTGRYTFRCDDPWAEFDFPNNRYLNKPGQNVNYSDLAIYAYCVVDDASNQKAVEAYRAGKVDLLEGKAWAHFIKN